VKALFFALLSTIKRRLKLEGVRANEQMKIECRNVPEEAMPLIAEQLRAFGARVTFSGGWSGVVASIAGKMQFAYDRGTLTVTVLENAGHFPQALLIGGIKQTVEEACEIVRRRILPTGMTMEASA
jgi:hypothetical protein